MPHLEHGDCPWDRLDLLLEKCIIRTGLTWSAAHSKAGHTQTQSFLHQPHSEASFIHNTHMCTHQNMCPCLKQPIERPADVGFSWEDLHIEPRQSIRSNMWPGSYFWTGGSMTMHESGMREYFTENSQFILCYTISSMVIFRQIITYPCFVCTTYVKKWKSFKLAYYCSI